MMSIRKYFKLVTEKDTVDTKTAKFLASLPDPNGDLSKLIPSSAIRAANESVRELLKEKRGARKAPYSILTPAQRYAIGKRAAEHRVTAIIRYYAKRFPHLALKETTVRRIKNAYLLELKSNPVLTEPETDEAVPELPCKKKGRPLLIGEELDKQVHDYLHVLRKHGTPVNIAIVIACGEGIVKSKDANLLAVNDGTITLSKDWAKYVLKRMGWVKRRSSTKAKVMAQNFDKVKQNFLQDVENIIAMDEIPTDMIIN